MKIIKLTQNSKGFTLVEILICVVIIGFIISPLSYSFISSAKIQKASQSVNEAVSNAEKLLNEVESKMTKDITEYITYPTVGDNKYDYLQGKSEFKKIEEFIEPLEASYRTDQYAYEVALWRFDKKLINDITGEFIIDSNSLKSAYKLYSNDNYMLDSPTAENKSAALLSQLPIQFKVSEEQQRLFNDTTKKYILDDSNTDNLIWKDFKAYYEDGTIKLKDEMGKSVGQAIMDNVGRQVGISVELNESPQTLKDIGIVGLDLSQIPRQSYEKFIFKFVNKTGYNNILRVKLNKDELLKPKIIVEGIDASNPKISIEYVDTMQTQENYLIAVIVRELRPSIGQEGKILKKMFNIYSYDVSIGY